MSGYFKVLRRFRFNVIARFDFPTFCLSIQAFFKESENSKIFDEFKTQAVKTIRNIYQKLNYLLLVLCTSSEYAETRINE